MLFLKTRYDDASLYSKKSTLFIQLCLCWQRDPGSPGNHLSEEHATYLGQDYFIDYAKQRPFRCGVCWKTYVNRESLRTHITYKHSRQSKHTCPFCDKRFDQKFQLIGHIASRHDPSAKVSCECCGAKYSYRQDLRRHMGRCTGVQENSEKINLST